MAIIDDVPGITVEVMVDGAALKEYGDQDETEAPKTVTKYIEAVSDANFEIRYSCTGLFSQEYGIKVQVKLDGEYMDDHVWRSEQIFKKRERRFTGANTRLGGVRFCQKFRFAEFNLEESNAREIADSTRERLAMAGEITVKFFRVRNIQTCRTFGDQLHGQLSVTSTIQEKAAQMDAISHFGSLDEPVEKGRASVVNCDYVDGKKSPFATYRFKYRSLAALKSLCIIPRTPSPTPLEDRPEEDLDREQMLELIKKLKKRGPRVNSPSRAVKRKRKASADEDSQDDVSVIEERPVKRRNLPAAEDEVIELD